MHRNRSTWDTSLAESFMGLCGLLLIVTLLIGLWLIVKACSMVGRGLASRPRSTALLICFGIFLTLAILVAVTACRLLPLDGLFVLSTLALVAVARIVELANDTCFQRGLSLDSVMQDMFHGSWFEAA